MAAAPAELLTEHAPWAAARWCLRAFLVLLDDAKAPLPHLRANHGSWLNCSRRLPSEALPMLTHLLHGPRLPEAAWTYDPRAAGELDRTRTSCLTLAAISGCREGS